MIFSTVPGRVTDGFPVSALSVLSVRVGLVKGSILLIASRSRVFCHSWPRNLVSESGGLAWQCRLQPSCFPTYHDFLTIRCWQSGFASGNYLYSTVQFGHAAANIHHNEIKELVDDRGPASCILGTMKFELRQFPDPLQPPINDPPLGPEHRCTGPGTWSRRTLMCRYESRIRRSPIKFNHRGNFSRHACRIKNARRTARWVIHGFLCTVSTVLTPHGFTPDK